MSIYVTQSSMASPEEYMEEIKPIFETKYMTIMEPVYKRLQGQLKEYLNVLEVSLFVNTYFAIRVGLTGRKAALK